MNNLEKLLAIFTEGKAICTCGKSSKPCKAGKNCKFKDEYDPTPEDDTKEVNYYKQHKDRPKFMDK